jgi:EAL domain-containing protein (putative c-di-GMP-specific phosphodiesterase class I)
MPRHSHNTYDRGAGKDPQIRYKRLAMGARNASKHVAAERRAGSLAFRPTYICFALQHIWHNSGASGMAVPSALAGDADSLYQSGTLYLCAPELATEGKLSDVLSDCGIGFDMVYDSVLGVPLKRDYLSRLSSSLSTTLSEAELLGTKCCLVPNASRPSAAQLMQTQPLHELVQCLQEQWLLELLNARRLVTFFQPIVCTRDPGNVFAYECLLRAQPSEGRLITPDRLYRAARITGQIDHLDRLARVTAIETAVARRLETHIFINFNPSSVVDPEHSLRSTIEAAYRSGIAPDRFVFEVVESDEIRDVQRLLDILQVYREAGFQVALDDVGAGYSSLALLTDIKPDLIKLDMSLLRDVHRDAFKSHVAAKLLELASDLDIRTVVEGVESELQWRWAVDHGAHYAQGYLFARPQAQPPRPPFFHYSAAGSEAALPV